MAATAPVKDPRFRIRTKMLLVLLGISLIPLLVFGYIARQDLDEVSRYTVTATTAIGERASQDSAQALEDLGARIGHRCGPAMCDLPATPSRRTHQKIPNG